MIDKQRQKKKQKKMKKKQKKKKLKKKKKRKKARLREARSRWLQRMTSLKTQPCSHSYDTRHLILQPSPKPLNTELG